MSARIERALNAIAERWANDRVELRPGASEVAISAFEERNRVRLPPDMRAYYLRFDGMPTHECPGDLIRFWSLEETKCAADWGAGESWALERRDLFLFADFSIDASAWGISLGAGPEYGHVFPVGLLGRPLMVAESFAEFLELCTAESKLLFGVSP